MSEEDAAIQGPNYRKRMSSIKVHVGGVPSNFEEWTTAEVYFHGFGDLSRVEYTRSPEFSCFGHKWELLLYPGALMVRTMGMSPSFFITCQIKPSKFSTVVALEMQPARNSAS